MNEPVLAPFLSALLQEHRTKHVSLEIHIHHDNAKVKQQEKMTLTTQSSPKLRRCRWSQTGLAEEASSNSVVSTADSKRQQQFDHALPRLSRCRGDAALCLRKPTRRQDCIGDGSEDNRDKARSKTKHTKSNIGHSRGNSGRRSPTGKRECGSKKDKKKGGLTRSSHKKSVQLSSFCASTGGGHEASSHSQTGTCRDMSSTRNATWEETADACRNGSLLQAAPAWTAGITTHWALPRKSGSSNRVASTLSMSSLTVC